jgi:hypothetical protein
MRRRAYGSLTIHLRCRSDGSNQPNQQPNLQRRIRAGDEGLIRADRTLDNVLGEEFRMVNPRPGDGLGIGFGLTNRGPFAVEIVGIGMPYSTDPLMSVRVITDVRAYRAPDPPAPTQWEPFRPFVLKPNQARDMAVTGRFRACLGGISLRHINQPRETFPQFSARRTTRPWVP